MENRYLKLKQKQQKESDDFPFMFAFNKEQFAEGMKKLGLKENDTDKIFSIGGGGYIRKTDSKAMNDLFLRHEQEMNTEIENDKTGENFIFEMFFYELSNHEYGYTYELEDTLKVLGLTMEDINRSVPLSIGLNMAKEKF